MNFQISDEQRMLVDSLRAFGESEFSPHEEQVERDDTLAFEDELREWGA